MYSSHTCQRDTGAFGRYYRGREVGANTTTANAAPGLTVTTITGYRIEGSEEVWVCRGCLLKARVQALVLGLVFGVAAAIAAWLGWRSDQAGYYDLVTIVCYVIAFMLAVYGVAVLLRALFGSSDEWRDNIAIHRVTGGVNSRTGGTNAVRHFTRKEYAKLR